MTAYGVTRQRNFEGKKMLEFVGDMEQHPALAEDRRKLFEARLPVTGRAIQAARC